uniref:SGNH_hydro domain-containing protein n=1 Tax=Elaeophora elaphi TaxID=1147741 RepID=A0A0R3S1H8_9BILA
PHNVPCSQLIVFGDDFTDDGVEFNVHSHGFARNSNGPVWPEYLNRMLECDEYINYAYSGAQSDYNNIFFSDWSGILWQIEYHFMSRRTAPKNSLIILQVGGLLELMLQQKRNDGSTTNVEKINENIAHAVLGLINAMDNGNIVIMNLIDPFEAPGYATFTANENSNSDISSMVSHINSKLWRLIVTEGHENQQVGLFDLNAAITDAMRGLNTNEPFTYQQSNMTSLKIFDYAYHNQWYPSTLVHYKIAQKLVKFLEDL